jgi:hypothetical protein
MPYANPEDEKVYFKKYYEANKSRRQKNHRKWYEKNREKRLKTVKIWQKNNKPKIRARLKKITERLRVQQAIRYARDPEVRRKNKECKERWLKTARGRHLDKRRMKRYYKLHRAEHLARVTARRVAKRRLQIGDKVEIAAFYKHVKECARIRCYWCKSLIPKKKGKRTVDHLIPLCRGGFHAIGNLAPCCLRCNLSKGRRTEDEYRAILQDASLVKRRRSCT